MKIRPATIDDAAEIAAVIHSISELRPYLADDVAPSVVENLRCADDSDSSEIIVAANDDGQVLGYCAFHWVPILFFSGGEAYVTELFVRSPDTGRGIGTKLLDAAAAEAERRGCSRLSLLNGRQGESYQRRFYEKRGWVERPDLANFILRLPRSRVE